MRDIPLDSYKSWIYSKMTAYIYFSSTKTDTPLHTPWCWAWFHKCETRSIIEVEFYGKNEL